MCRNFLNCSKQSFIFSLLLFLLLQSHLFGDGVEIKSLRVYSSADQTLFPIIDHTDKTKSSITIEFDVQSSYMPFIIIIFKFCDSDWNSYDNAFLTNPMYNTENNLWFETLPANIMGARYHYFGRFPNNNVTFPFSGKWKFFIVDSQNRNLVYASGRFFVVTPVVKLNVQFENERLEGEIPDLAILGRTLSIRTDFVLPDSLFPSNVSHVEIVNNRKLDYPIIIDRTQYGVDRFYEWNASNKFSFVARNLKPGNEYRQTDIRDIGRYNTPTVNSRFGDIETSNLYTFGKKDFFGGSVLVDFKNIHSDYMNVLFRLRSPDDVKSSIFLVGAFNDWKVLPGYEMYDDKGMMNLTVELKRGVYDYQYVTGDVVNDHVENIDWQILEGNYWETGNEFYIFLYYRTEEKGGYDKIIGYKKIKTGTL